MRVVEIVDEVGDRKRLDGGEYRLHDKEDDRGADGSPAADVVPNQRPGIGVFAWPVMTRLLLGGWYDGGAHECPPKTRSSTRCASRTSKAGKLESGEREYARSALRSSATASYHL